MRALKEKARYPWRGKPGGWGKMIKYYHPFTFNYTINPERLQDIYSDRPAYPPKRQANPYLTSQGDISRVGRLHLIQGGKP